MNASGYLQSLLNIVNQAEFIDQNGRHWDYDKAVRKLNELLRSQTGSGKKIIFIGNGGSAGIASHMAVDYWRNGGMRAVCYNEGAQLTCISNDFGYEQVFAKPIQMFADAGDILVAISSSGRSQNILNGAAAAKALGCKVITLSGFSANNPLRKMGDWNIYIPSTKYGFVELAHQIILHAMLDLIVEQKKKVG